MRELYVCDACTKLFKPDEIVLIHGSKGNLFFCSKCYKQYQEERKAKKKQKTQ